MKESEKINKYFLLAREPKKLWNMKVTVITFKIGVFGIVLKFLEKSLSKQKLSRMNETTHTTKRLISTLVLRRVFKNQRRYEDHTISFQSLFRMGTFLDSTHMKH